MFLLNINLLKDGEPEKILSGEYPPSFLDIDEPDLQFLDPVILEGTVVKTDKMLIFRFSFSTYAMIPCRVCNEVIKHKMTQKDILHTEEIQNNLYDYTEILREEILIHVPSFIECNNDNCPEREKMPKYLANRNFNS